MNKWIKKTEYHSDIQKEWNLFTWDNTDGSGGYYVKWNKSDRKNGYIPYDYTYTWNLKTEASKQSKMQRDS